MHVDGRTCGFSQIRRLRGFYRALGFCDTGERVPSRNLFREFGHEFIIHAAIPGAAVPAKWPRDAFGERECAHSA